MDNITHSLIGAAFGEAFFQGAKSKNIVKESSRPVFYFISILANNFPDLDLFYYFLDPTQLGYLLHHRGHTHTFLWLWPQFFILMSLTYLGYKLSNKNLNKTKAMWLALTAIAGLHMHIIMDFFNVYGVHPLHPFNNEWFYGDSIFIIEPLFWACLIPLLFIAAKSWFKYVVLIPCFILILFGLYAEALNFISLLLIAGLSTAVSLVLLKSSPFLRPFYSLLFFTAVILTFSSFSKWTKSNISQEVSLQKMTKIFDIIVSPAPANPFCWSVLLLDGDKVNYRIHKGVYNLLPNISSCPSFFNKTPKELSKSNVVFKNSAFIGWHGFYKTKHDDLFGETAKNCQLRAWLQFVRAPLKDGLDYKDARFLRGEKSFANLKSSDQKGEDCPPFPVPWKPPFEYEKFLKKAL